MRLSKDITLDKTQIGKAEFILILLYLEDSFRGTFQDLRNKFFKELGGKIKERFSDVETQRQLIRKLAKSLDKSLKEVGEKYGYHILSEYLEILRKKGPASEERLNEVIGGEERKALDALLEIKNPTAILSNDDPEWVQYQELRRFILEAVICDVYYRRYRKEICHWIERTKKCDALLVRAPLGLGKTIAIAEALNNNKNKSAIIFMPTTRLCNLISEYFDPREFYLIEGARKETCFFFKKVVRRYQEFDYSKGDICDMCRKEECKIRDQYEKARKQRIIITTHQQYPRFYSIPRERYWEGHGLRDYFIIDENIISNYFMSPVKVSFGELNRDLTKILDSGMEFDYPVKEKLRKLRSRIRMAWNSKLIAPIDPNFDPTRGDSIRIKRVMGELKANDVFVRNLRKFYFWAVKNGYVIGHEDMADGQGIDYFAYLYRPVSYQLNLWDEVKNERVIPKHVFFDATSMKKEVFNNYFPGTILEEMKIDVPALGELRIHHANATNLPKMSSSPNTDKKIRGYLEYIFREHGDKKNYFAITVGEREDFIRSFFRKKSIYLKGTEEANKSGNGYLVTCHYGDQKGINDAQGCEVGIMLGTYFRPPEAIVIGCLPYIRDKIRRDCNLRGGVYSFDSKRGRCYYPRFSYIDQMDYWLRMIEHEQGMGRTRHLYHDVDFYVVTKDPVDTYSISKWATYKLDKEGNDIFARKKSSLWRGEEYEAEARKLVAQKGFFTPKELALKLGRSRKAITNWISDAPTKVVKIKHGKYDLHPDADDITS